jgi:hypothetical protein
MKVSKLNTPKNHILPEEKTNNDIQNTTTKLKVELY